ELETLVLPVTPAQAIVAALRLAGYRAELVSTAVAVQAVLEESPNAVVLQAGDLIVRVGDTPTPSIAALSDALAQQQAGERIVLTLERGGTMQQVNVTLLPPAEGGTTPRIGVSVQNYGLDLDLPFAVQITPQKIVGGPSAGLMFALTIYNMLSPDDLTGGQRVAGTGTIDIDGRVGPIGGVTQKIAAAETAGARYFVVPSANYAEAARAARTITLIPVETMQEAVEKLRSLTGD
ncbi:MAG TPA: PDZ domain-containing protein, partial [Roseiflexaceae bacterium]|nr:PDZ domain-containing protein [Roseiflexaceae bacterium]